MPIPPVPAEALHDAMDRFDQNLLATPDWANWEQNRAHRYAIEYNGQRYPVKQIVSMATGIPVSEFSGGEAAGDANRYVAARGLTIVELRRRNRTWVRDELILALDMYLRYAGNPPQKGSAEIDELSDTLNRLGRYLGIATTDRFRNVNGVYMKLMNFRRFDPVFTEVGKRGLSRGGQAEEAVWNEFAPDPQRCHAVALTIREALAHVQEGETITDLAADGIEEAEEGRVITAMHRRFERNSALIETKKRRALATLGRLACEACGFDFEERYGDRGEGFMECHHTKPVHTLRPGEKTKIGDLRLLCANWVAWIGATAVGLTPGSAILSAPMIARLIHRVLWPRREVAPKPGREPSLGQPAAVSVPRG
jgi:predicted HNH restriction endonuclease